jgi:hypothetical protein
VRGRACGRGFPYPLRVESAGGPRLAARVVFDRKRGILGEGRGDPKRGGKRRRKVGRGSERGSSKKCAAAAPALSFVGGAPTSLSIWSVRQNRQSLILSLFLRLARVCVPTKESGAVRTGGVAEAERAGQLGGGGGKKKTTGEKSRGGFFVFGNLRGGESECFPSPHGRGELRCESSSRSVGYCTDGIPSAEVLLLFFSFSFCVVLGWGSSHHRREKKKEKPSQRGQGDRK